jgi:hypothetical protein
MSDQELAHAMRDLEEALFLRTRPRNEEMKELTQRLRMLRDDAEECLLISRLATDQTKRLTFRKLATQLEEMAAELGAVIAAKRTSGATRPAGRVSELDWMPSWIRHAAAWSIVPTMTSGNTSRRD